MVALFFVRHDPAATHKAVISNNLVVITDLVDSHAAPKEIRHRTPDGLIIIEGNLKNDAAEGLLRHRGVADLDFQGEFLY